MSVEPISTSRTKASAAIRIIEPPDEDERWRDELIVKEVKGRVIVSASSSNVVTILSKHSAWRGVIALDEFAERIITTRDPPWAQLDAPAKAKPGPWSDADSARAANWLHRFESLHIAPKTIEASVPVIAQKNVVHPVKKYLGPLVWDGVPRLDHLFPAYLGTNDTPYTRAVGARWAISAVARISKPGCQVDSLPILEGPQGLGKSSCLRVLAGEWFSDTLFEPGDKDAFQSIRGVWIYELSELDTLSRRDISRVKAFISTRIDRYRPSYGRHVIDVPRQCVFAGTTNASIYLTDETGARRFLPVRTGRIDLDALHRDRDQIWAEAKARFSRREQWHLGADLSAEASAEQEARFQRDPWEEPVRVWLYPRATQSVVCSDIMAGLGIETARMTRADEMRVGAIVRRLGWARHQERDGDSRRWVYRLTP